MSPGAFRFGVLSRVADAILGCLWMALAAAKVLHEGRAQYVVGLLGAAIGTWVSWSIIAMELLVGTALLVGPRRVAPYARLASISLLAMFGAMAYASPSAHCHCAGQILAPSRDARLLLVALMLSLAGLGALAPARPNVPPPRSPQAGPRPGIMLVVLVALAACAAGLLIGRMDESPPAVQGETARVLPLDRAPPAMGPSLRAAEGSGRLGSPANPVATAASETTLRRGCVRLQGTDMPVAGAFVWLSRRTAPRMLLGDAAVTDEQGAFVLRQPPADDPMLVFVVAPSRRPWCRALADVPVRDDTLWIELEAGCTIVGRVVDGSGRPIPGASVEARGIHAEDTLATGDFKGWDPDQQPELARGLTNSEGRFRFEGLLPGDYTLHAAKDGFGVAIGAAGPPRISAREARPESMDVVLHALYEARVLAVDDTSGDPIRYATIVRSLVPGRPWNNAAVERTTFTVTTPEAHRGLVGGGASRILLYRAGEQTMDEAVGFTIRASGYLDAQVRVEPTLVGRADPTVVRMRRAEDEGTADVTFRLVLPGGSPGPSGRFACVVSKGGDLRAAPSHTLWFESGRAAEPIPLSPGEYRFGLRGVSGSTGLIEAYLRGPPVTFSIQGPAPVSVEIPLALGCVCIRPRLSSGAPIVEYVVGVEYATWDRRLLTWLEDDPAPPCDDCGLDECRSYWLVAGRCRLAIGKSGYQSVLFDLDVPVDGSVVSWEPVLRREPP